MMIPRFNMMAKIGFMLLMLGFLLTPIIIGIPLIGIGSGIFSLGVMTSILEIFPIGRKIIDGFKESFTKAGNMVVYLVKDIKNDK